MIENNWLVIDPPAVKLPSMRNFTELPPLSLYIHIPWCIKKCPYCDFNSHSVRDNTVPEKRYIDALLADLIQEVPDCWGRSISSVFIGGGTPSLFSPEALDRLLSGVRALTNLLPETEITMEANPGTFEQHKFSEFYSLGINRLSIGIQSFQAKFLKALGRVHTDKEAKQSVDIARLAGFKRLNLDLMFALPGQSVDESNRDLQIAIDLKSDHISWYQLTLEPNTLFYSRPPVLPDDELIWSMQSAGLLTLSNAGFNQYEVSAFAGKKQECIHNLNYWKFGDYLGIGAGAHGKISFASNGKIIRRHKSRHPEQYMIQALGAEKNTIENEICLEETGLEFMMNALRLREGVSKTLFQRHTGLPLTAVSRQIERAKEQGLIRDDIDYLCTTELGFAHLNSLLDMFMPDKHKTVFIPIKCE